MTAGSDTRVDHVWLTPAEVADYARVSLVTVHRHLAAGTMRSRQTVPNGRRHIRREWAEEWADTRPALPTPIRRARARRRAST